MSAELWVAIVSVLVAIAIGVWTVRTQRRPKRLDYRIVGSAGLLASGAQGLSQPLTIEWNGIPVQAPWLTTIRIMNSGKRAVLASEYVEPIEVSYAGQGPFQCTVVAESRPGLLPSDAPLWRVDGVAGPCDWPLGSVAIRPPLMNPGEWLELQLLSDGDPGRVTVTAVFPDQARPMKPVNDRAAGPTRRFEVAALILAAGLSFGIGTVASALGEEPETIMIPVVAVLLSIAVATGLWRTGRNDAPR